MAPSGPTPLLRKPLRWETPAGAVRGVMHHLAEIEQVLELIVGTARDLARSSTTPAA